MARYRKDKVETNSHGQELGYALWMGGPSLTYVGSVICPWGRANFFKSAEESVTNTGFTMPGYVHAFNRRIYGYLTCLDSGIYTFTPNRQNDN
jgi:hypothetical protein